MECDTITITLNTYAHLDVFFIFITKKKGTICDSVGVKWNEKKTIYERIKD
jgi:hypothetical protein